MSDVNVGGKILRWSTVGSVYCEDDVKLILHQARREFPDVRFKATPYCHGVTWIQALVLHDRGAGYGHRFGDGEQEIARFVECMSESAQRWRRRRGEISGGGK